MPSIPLPAGYHTRAARTTDVPDLHCLVTAAERHLHGHAGADPERADPDRIAADLARPGLDPATDTLLVSAPDGKPAGWAWVDRRCEIAVHPAHHGRGLGGFLLDWVEARARRAGTPRLTQTVPDADTAAGTLLRTRDWAPLVTQWLLAIALTDEPVVPASPAGVTVRQFRPGDGPAAHQLIEDAFDEWQPRRQAYPEWARRTVERDTFAPALSPLAFAGDDLVGAVLSLEVPGRAEGYVDRVAVRRDHRGRGIARLLLRHAFHAGHRRGQRACTLWTHSDTGALALYQRVGMSVRRSSTVYARTLSPAG